MNAVSLRHYIMEAVEEEDQSCLAAVNRLERPTDWLIWLPSNGPRTSYCRRFPRTFGAVSLMQVFYFLLIDDTCKLIINQTAPVFSPENPRKTTQKINPLFFYILPKISFKLVRKLVENSEKSRILFRS